MEEPIEVEPTAREKLQTNKKLNSEKKFKGYFMYFYNVFNELFRVLNLIDKGN